MIWIIGEYAERIDNADELLESFLESFEDETPQVQLQMLTSTVKLFLKRPADTQKMVQDVLTLATQDSDNPDLRDRGYIYWRLLSTDPEAAKQVVLAEKHISPIHLPYTCPTSRPHLAHISAASAGGARGEAAHLGRHLLPRPRRARGAHLAPLHAGEP